MENEENLLRCFKHCLKVVFTKINNFYNRFETKALKYLILFITGVPLSIFALFLITSLIPISVSEDINKQINLACLSSIEYNKENFWEKHFSFWFSGYQCFNINLEDYDKNYEEYSITVSKIYYDKANSFISKQNYQEIKIPFAAYGVVIIPHVEGNELYYTNQTFLLTNATSQKIEIPEKEGYLKIIGFWKRDGQDMLNMKFFHTISFWNFIVRNFYVVK